MLKEFMQKGIIGQASFIMERLGIPDDDKDMGFEKASEILNHLLIAIDPGLSDCMPPDWHLGQAESLISKYHKGGAGLDGMVAEIRKLLNDRDELNEMLGYDCQAEIILI